MTTCEVLLDVDVVIKLAAYDLLSAIAHPGCGPGCSRETGVIATTRFVATSKLKRVASAAATTRLTDFLAGTNILEPTEAELGLAALFESEAAKAGFELDLGESQLCSIALVRGVPALLTGDKRAIAAAELLIDVVPRLNELEKRLACLEQAITLAVQRLGATAVRNLVMAELGIDKDIEICFQCTNPSLSDSFSPTGLSSYINSVRLSAPTLLMPGYILTVPLVA